MLLALQETKERMPHKDIYMIDVGANIGWFTLTAASRGFKVISFEPFLDNQFYLKQSIQSNPEFAPNIQVFETALGNKNKNCSIYSTNTNLLNGFLRCDKDKVDNNLQLRANAKLSTLDSYISVLPEDAQVGVIKIDTEGMDYFVLKGGSEFIKKHRPRYIQCEYNPVGMAPLKIRGNDLIHILQSLGYEVHRQ